MSNTFILPFCSDKCLKEHAANSQIDKTFDERASFNLIASSIEQMFYHIPGQSEKDINNNKRWIKDVVCSAWCDCSNNFENNKLFKIYENKCVERSNCHKSYF